MSRSPTRIKRFFPHSLSHFRRFWFLFVQGVNTSRLVRMDLPTWLSWSSMVRIKSPTHPPPAQPSFIRLQYKRVLLSEARLPTCLPYVPSVGFKYIISVGISDIISPPRYYTQYSTSQPYIFHPRPTRLLTPPHPSPLLPFPLPLDLSGMVY